MVMRDLLFNRIHWLQGLLLALLLAATQVQAATFSASVDRKEVAERDTFTLMLRYSEQVGFGSPDLTPLQNDFQVLNQQRSNQFRSINGKTESFTEWTLTLTPRRNGKLTIPPIRFENQQTQPITINVRELSDDVKAQIAKEFFFDTEISQQDNYYVQGQILYTEKLYYSVSHEDATLSEFKVTDALVQPLGDVRQYTTVVDGQRLGVYERRFAIFPEESGELVIPGQRFSARISNPYDRWSRGRQGSAVSKPITLQVKPIPQDYPQAPWIPAENLSISETFSTPPQQWVAGEPVTRTLIMTAKGLPGSQLPAIALPVVDNLRYYPDQTQQNEQSSDDGLSGTSEQSIALVPGSSGRILLPEIRIPWWNTRSATLEYAVLPAHSIQIKPAKGTAASSQTAEPVKNNSADSAADATAQPAAGETSSTAELLVWQLAVAVLVLSNGLFLLLWWHVRRTTPARPAASESAQQDHPQKTLKQHWQALNKACQQGDAAAIRSHLLDWANAGGLNLRNVNNQQPLVSLSQLGERLPEPRLQAALAELDARLYSPQQNSAYNGQNLLALLKELQRQSGKTETQRAVLYPH
ncbi:BatD family protein [Thalassolituus hydrocarboniclasticus]|uniref:Protein BatD n=1 Tax=Thalassolituus hydrocarboniclasticus TaxID=2742796 RepID=A0ABY6AB37_9GAMM|nr:BatD family protein [Thalassolituus hydrocarboniclasticus]UXD87130.1 protein BatD [Thalassolituus hydrocarboniclasticus]